MEDIVRNVIAKRRIFHDVLAPGALLLAVPPERAGALAEMSFFSGRQEYWAFYVSLLAYSQETSSDRNKVLAALSGSAEDDQNHVEAFSAYCSRAAGLPREIIVPVASAVRYMTEGRGLWGSMAEVSHFHLCEIQCQRLPEEERRACIESCLQNPLTTLLGPSTMLNTGGLRA